jgi:hypothetical protein
VGIGAPLKVSAAVSVEPVNGIPIGFASVLTNGGTIAAGVTDVEAIEATDSPFMLSAFTVNV